jgi:hypothetical protein
MSLFLKVKLEKIIKQILEKLLNKETKILWQNPGFDEYHSIKYIITLLDRSISLYIPNSDIDSDFIRNMYILKNMIYIVEIDNCFKNVSAIRGGISDNRRTYGENFCNIAWEDPLTFNYWNLPPNSFDILFSKEPVRLEIMKDDAIIIKL